MTREEFKKNPPLYEKVIFEGKEYDCIGVNTQELCNLDLPNNSCFWVRCENVERVNKEL